MEFLIRSDTPRIPHKKHWQFCVGSGHALLALRTDYTRQLKFIHDTLGIERVRFHGIFNDDMRTRANLEQRILSRKIFAPAALPMTMFLKQE